MNSKGIDQGVVAALRRFARENHRLPSYSELAKMMGFASKNAAFRLVERLIAAGILEKDNKGRLKMGLRGMPLAGLVEAGFPSPAEEELIDTLSLDDYLIRNPDASFLLKVRGDSMIDAGIMDGDLVIVERGADPKSGNIVLAQIDGNWTLKYFQKRGRAVTLLAANKKYPPFTPREELVIAGTVTAAMRRYR